jgi:hypothetical protein
MKSSAPFSTPESRAALEQLKEFVRANVSADKVEANAFRLVGESQDVIDAETRQLFEAMRRQSPPWSHSEAFGLAFALRELIRERIREIEEGAS